MSFFVHSLNQLLVAFAKLGKGQLAFSLLQPVLLLAIGFVIQTDAHFLLHEYT